MQCEDFEIRLNDVLDERRTLSSAPELAEHARQCGACREIARSYEIMLSGLSYEQLPSAPAWLAERVVKETLLRTPADRTTGSRWIERMPAFALAASVLIAAGVVWWIDSRRQLPNQGAAGGGEVQVAQTGNKHKPELPASPAIEMHTAVPAVDDTAANTVEYRDAEVSLDIVPGADWAPAGAEWAQKVAESLQPVTQPTVGAISGFLNLWGIAEEGHRS